MVELESAIIAELSAIVSEPPVISPELSVAAGVSAAFWPQPSAAIERVSANSATIARARSLRIVYVVTSSHVHRAGGLIAHQSIGRADLHARRFFALQT